MITGPIIAEIAALVGDPARATMVSALLDGRALTASELALAARITPQTASTPSREADRGGRALGGPEWAASLFPACLARGGRHDRAGSSPSLSRRDRDTARYPVKPARSSAARICYDHLAGRLSVDLTDSFVAREYIVLDDEAAEITTAGTRFLTEFGIELPTRRSSRRHFCRLCLDWTERRPHIAGAVGAAITKRYFDLGWMERMKRSHAVIVTPSGRRGFQKTFGIEAPEPGLR